MTESAWESALGELVPVMERLQSMATQPAYSEMAQGLLVRLTRLASLAQPEPSAFPLLSEASWIGLELMARELLKPGQLDGFRGLYNIFFQQAPESSELQRFERPRERPDAPGRFLVSRAPEGPRIRGTYQPIPGLDPAFVAPAAPAEPGNGATAIKPAQAPITDYFAAILAQGSKRTEAPANTDALSAEVVPATEASLPKKLLVKASSGGGGLSEQEFLARVAENCLDSLAMHGRHRLERHLNESEREDSHLLITGDAWSLVGGQALSWLQGHWEEALDSDDEFRSFALAYACATLDTVEPLAFLGRALARLPLRSVREANRAAEALCLVNRPELPFLAERWCGVSHPVLRSAALSYLSRTEALDPVRSLQWTLDPNLAVVESALHSLARAPELPKDAPAQIERWLGVRDPRVAWAAARCLTLHGDPRAYRRLDADPGFEKVLGPQALELLILAGGFQDRERLVRVVSGQPVTPAQLNGVARFGLAESYAYLVGHLGHEEFSTEAADALELMFGPHPDEEAREDPEAWRARLSQLRLEPDVRYRLGQPWQLASLTTEIERGELSRHDLGLRFEEFGARLGLRVQVNINGWIDSLRRDTESALRQLGGASSGLRPGSFDSRVLR